MILYLRTFLGHLSIGVRCQSDNSFWALDLVELSWGIMYTNECLCFVNVSYLAVSVEIRLSKLESGFQVFKCVCYNIKSFMYNSISYSRVVFQKYWFPDNYEQQRTKYRVLIRPSCFCEI